MNKQLILQLRDTPEVLNDYYLDHGLTMCKELQKLYPNICTINKLCTIIKVEDPFVFVEELDYLCMFPIKDIQITFEPYFSCGSYYWVKESKFKGKSQLPKKIYNRFYTGLFAIKYNNAYEAIDKVKRTMLEMLNEQATYLRTKELSASLT